MEELLKKINALQRYKVGMRSIADDGWGLGPNRSYPSEIPDEEGYLVRLKDVIDLLVHDIKKQGN